MDITLKEAVFPPAMEQTCSAVEFYLYVILQFVFVRCKWDICKTKLLVKSHIF